MKWALDRVAAVCGGTSHGSAMVTSVAIDSRAVEPGALFVAVTGERDDGHRYLDDALGAGAAAVVVEAGRLGDRVGVEVTDPTAALLALAVSRRGELDLPVVAVTGSSGKTTTKDLIAAALGPGSHASPRSFNNEFGVPLTVLGTPDSAHSLVVEVGSRGAGHIAHLGPAIAPDVAVITNVGRAHLDLFGSLDAIADAKWELIDALGDDGIAVLPAGDERLTGRRHGDLITFGEESGADVDAVAVAIGDTGCASLTLRSGDGSERVTMPVPGRHQAVNAAAAAAAALALGISLADVAPRLESAEISPWRMETAGVSVGDLRFTVVNDAYNANPDSMAAALTTVAAMPGRHIAVLGKMHELGVFEAEAHREAGALAASLGFEVIAVGDDPGIAEGAGKVAVSVPDVPTAVERVRASLRTGDIVLIKASRAAGLEEVANGLQGATS